MRSRFFKAINFLAFNLLFFALYLNFVQGNNNDYQMNNSQEVIKANKKIGSQSEITAQRDQTVSVTSMVVLP